MRKLKAHLIVAAALLFAAGPGFAQSNAPAAGAAGSFERLAAGDQKIAHALFLSQRPSGAGPAPLNLEQIAARKDGQGWQPVFKSMKADGLVQARTLREIVSGEAVVAGADMHPRERRFVVVTTGSGRAVASISPPAEHE